MPQKSKRERILFLEAKAGCSREDKLAKALDCAVALLMDLLPDIPAISRRVQTAPAGFASIIEVDGKNSSTRIQELGFRIAENELTEDDRQVVQTFSQQGTAELRLLGQEGAEFIRHWGQLLHDVKNAY